MKTFEQLESGFLMIDENDYSTIIRFFYENEESIMSIKAEDQETGIKYLWMLTEILNSAFERNEQKLIKSLSISTIKKYKRFTVQFDYDKTKDSYFKLLLIKVGNEYLSQKKYLLAFRILKELYKIEERNKKIEELYIESRRRMIIILSRTIGALGIILVLLKYILRIFEMGSRTAQLLTGFTGASLLIIFGIAEILLTNKRRK